MPPDIPFPAEARQPLIGTQILPRPLIDKGIEDVLDDMRGRARINTILLLTHSYSGYQYVYQGAIKEGRTPDPRGHAPMLWVRTDKKYYKDTAPRHLPELCYEGDLLDEIREPAEKRGITVYPRILESFLHNDAVPGMERALQIDAYGNPHHMYCYNHPEYKAWWLAQVEDLAMLHPYIPGFMFGQERGGPMTHLLLGHPPLCFCEYCRAKGRSDRIDVEQARQGMTALHALFSGIKAGDLPRDGVGVTLWRTLTKYPAALAWERQWYLSKEGHLEAVYHLLKRINPGVKVGWHIVHGHSWDMFYRAQTNFAEMASYSDWIKPVMYSDCAGKRSCSHFRGVLNRGILADLDERTAHRVFYQLQGLDPGREPSLDQIEGNETHAMSPDYVYRETKRIMAAVGGKVPVYPGLGFDVGGGDDNGLYMKADSRHVQQIVERAFAAGADGIFIPREYDEARPEMLNAAGEALKKICI